MSRQRRDKTDRRATVLEAARAIYIDLEGLKGQAPSLVGMRVDGVFSWTVLDRALASAAAAKGIEVVAGSQWFRMLIERAESEQRRICGFSRHETESVLEHFGVDLRPYYLDGHKLAKRCWRLTRPGDTPEEGWTQAFFEGCLGLTRPKHLHDGNAASRLRDVLGQLERRGEYCRLTGTAKGKWTKLLDYNELDVRHMATIVKAAAESLSELEAGPSVTLSTSLGARNLYLRSTAPQPFATIAAGTSTC